MRLPGQKIGGPQADQAVESKQHRGGALDCRIGPLPLGLHPEMGPHLLEGGLDLPAPHEDGDDPRRGHRTGTEEGLGVPAALRVPHQHPANGLGPGAGAFNRENGGGVSVRRGRGGSNLTFTATNALIARLKPGGPRRQDESLLLVLARKVKGCRRYMGGIVLPLDEALDQIARAEIFWTWM